MRTSLSVAFAVIFVVAISCTSLLVNDQEKLTDMSIHSLPDVKVESSLPSFRRQNEVEISGSFNEIDPSFIIGAMVDLKQGVVRSFDNCLKNGAKIKTVTLTEVAFRGFVEEMLVAQVEWLCFLRGQVSAKCKAEISIIKAAKVVITIESIDSTKLHKCAEKIPQVERDNYGIIIGYIDYLVGASLFRNYGREGKVRGYGAKIEGTWYSKAENTALDHRIIAIWSPLPLVAQKIEEIKAGHVVDLENETITAIERGDIDVESIRPLMIIKNRPW